MEDLFMNNSKGKIIAKMIIFGLIFLILSGLISFVLNPPAEFIRYSINDMYEEDNIDVVYVGASRYYRAFDPAVIDPITNKKSINIGSAGQSSIDTYYLMKEVFKKHNPEYVVLDLNRNRIEGNINSNHTRTLTSNINFSANKLEWIKSVFDYNEYYTALFPGFNEARPQYIISRAPIHNIQKKLSSGYRNYDYSSLDMESIYKGRGFLYTDKGYEKGGSGRQGAPERWDESRISAEKIEWFRKVVELCNQHNAKVLLVCPPVAYGNMIVDEQGFLDYANDFAKELGVDFIDFNLVRESKYQREDPHFYDRRHMTSHGGESFSKMFGEYLRDYSDGSLDENEYLYSDFQELLDHSRFLFSAWCEYDKEAQDIVTKYTAGAGEYDVEYQYLYNTKDDKEFKVYRDYDDNPYAQIEKLPEDAYKIRVQVREKGSEEHQQFYVNKISKIIK